MVSLALSTCLLIATLYIPGYLVSSTVLEDKCSAICMAPLPATALLAIMAIVYPVFGIAANYFSLALPLLLLSLGLNLTTRQLLRPQRANWSQLPSLVFFFFVVLVITAYVFCNTLSSPDCYFQGWDNVTHLATIRTFVRSGNYSPLANNFYLVTDVSPEVTGTGFYPSAWHELAAMLVSSMNIPVTEAANCVIIVSIVAIYPCSFFALMQSLGLMDRWRAPFYAVICLGIPAFPWDMISYGPLYPNLLGFALMPSCLALMLACIKGWGLVSHKAVCGHIALLVLTVIALGLAHPGSVFALGTISVPLLIATVSAKTSHFCRKKGLPNYLFGTLTLLAICLVWCACYKSSFVSSIAGVDWPSISSLKKAIVSALFLGVTTHPFQFIIPILSFIGCFSAARNSDKRWIIASWLIMVMLYSIDAGTDLPIKHLLTSFWYTDYHRTGSMLAIMAAILASMGVKHLFTRLSSIDEERAEGANPAATDVAATGIATLFFACLIFLPSLKIGNQETITTPYSYQINELSLMYDQSIIYYDVLSPEEESFCRSIEQIVGDNLILNEPQDGSTFAYSVYGLNVYYRIPRTPNEDSETEESKLIRLNLSEYATNESVRQTVGSLGAKYVLQLDAGDGDGTESRIYYSTYSDSAWTGIDSITPDTEGFTVVKSEGDMRLYKIG